MVPLAVIKIKVLNIIGRMYELDRVTAELGKSGAFHPDNALSFYSDTSGFSPVNDADPYAKAMGTMSDTLRLIGKADEAAGIRSSTKAVPSIADFQAYADTFASAVAEKIKARQAVEQKIQALDSEMKRVGHFAGLDIDLDELRRCRFVKIRFGSIPEGSFEQLSEYTHNPYVAFFPATKDDTHYWGMYCAPAEKIDEVDKVFSSLFFEQVSLDDLSGTVESVIKTIGEKRGLLVGQTEDINAQIDAYWQREKSSFKNLYAWLAYQSACFGIRRYAARYGENFILTGWIAADRETSITKRLDRMETVRYAFDDAADPEVLLHAPPVKLKNRALVRPYEFYVEVYGVPSYTEMDPTAFLAFTYTLLFGIMFADVGQGLCVALTGWLMWKLKKLRLGKIMIPCGISSSIFGFLFGSVFGFEHALDPVFKNVFGLAKKPVDVMESTSTVILFAIGLGIVLVLAAILTNIVCCLRRKQYTNGLFGPNGLAGFIFYGSVIFGFGGQILKPSLHIVTAPFVILCIVLPLAVMIFREVLGDLAEGKPDWKPESWGNLIMQNFFEVFEFVLSYLTNTISFIRTGAFVLVHAGMMIVIFSLAGMSAGFGFVLTIVIGNAFVIALEGLLSGVQCLRLDFYEMFSRFYDGSGRPYTPVVVGQES